MVSRLILPQPHRRCRRMSIFISAFGFGLVSASVIAIAAVGFTMQFGITNLINLAYGGIMITAAFVAYGVNRAGFSIWTGLAVAAACGAVASLVLNRVLYAPFLRRGTSHIGMVIISLAAALILSNVLLALVGYDNVSYAIADEAAVTAGGVIFTRGQVGILGISVAGLLASPPLLTVTPPRQAVPGTPAPPTPPPQRGH